MPGYEPGTEEQVALLNNVLGDSEELEVVHETAPSFAVISTSYEDGAFDKALRKKLGSNPVIIRKVGPKDHCVMRMLIEEEGKTAPDFIIHMDPAALKTLPEQAQQAFMYNALAQISCEREEQDDGNWEYKRAGDGRYDFRVKPPIAIAPETMARFGAFNNISNALMHAAKNAQACFDWHAVEPKDPDAEPETPVTPGPGNPALAQTPGSPDEGGVEQTEPGSEGCSCAKTHEGPCPASSAVVG